MKPTILIKLAILLCGSAAAVSFSDVVDMKASIKGNSATFLIHKKRHGFLALGFGKGMKEADIFKIEIENDKLVLQSCQLTDYDWPKNCSPKGAWILRESLLNDDRTWTVKVTRDISNVRVNGVKLDLDNIIFDLSDNEALEAGHQDKTNLRGVFPFSTVLQSQDSYEDSTSL